MCLNMVSPTTLSQVSMSIWAWTFLKKGLCSLAHSTEEREGLRKMTEPGRVTVRHSHPAFLAHLVPFSRPQRISSNGARKWTVVCPQTQMHTEAPSPLLWEPHAVIVGPPSATSHHPFGLGRAKKFVTSFLGGYWTRTAGPMASANIAGFFQVPEFSLPSVPPTRSFTSGCHWGGTNSMSPGFLENPQKS